MCNGRRWSAVLMAVVACGEYSDATAADVSLQRVVQPDFTRIGGTSATLQANAA